MPLTPTQTSLCNKLTSDYAGLIGPVKMAKDGIIGQRSALMGKLGGMGYSPPTVLADKLGMFKNAVGMSIPDPGDLNSLKSMLTQCDYFKKFGPTAALIGLTEGALNKISSLLDNFETGTPEFGAAKLASMLNQALSSLMPGGSGITDILKSAGQLLECLSSVCVAGDPSYFGGIEYMENDLTSLTESMGLVGDPSLPDFGTMNFKTIYSTVGMTDTQISTIDNVTKVVDDQKMRAKKAVADSITAVKGQIGGLF